MLRAPGVYRPRADTRLLVEAIREAALPRGAHVLDVGTGTGVLAVAAARSGAAEVTAVDVSRRAVLTAYLNTRMRRLPVRVERGDVQDPSETRQFDVILSNPPYVPSEQPRPPERGGARSWDAGSDGRAVLDPLCVRSARLLAPRGTLLIVHSALCGVERTLTRLRRSGLKASVVARRAERFGPVLRARAGLLEARGIIEPGQRHEQLVVIRGDRPEPLEGPEACGDGT
ncbi:release factor glutamine methyltransferase [Haloactinomyces albus]|uniref:Release factor glutamine methyltransferase n=1 Tax=Haloactinomyces albus TaxID=1352928 RepID=A0AAE3ZB20_9ACTN|nr:HemK2/MTQ2 family protein methyltransferase [Haloactinomyces albus]MDR7300229.1 release factor glutamine methyltransferase [Haloactinomyces albus]